MLEDWETRLTAQGLPCRKLHSFFFNARGSFPGGAGGPRGSKGPWATSGTTGRSCTWSFFLHEDEPPGSSPRVSGLTRSTGLSAAELVLIGAQSHDSPSLVG